MNAQKRRWFRMQVPAGQELAELRVGSRRIAVRLIDESAGGFAIICDHPLEVERGSTMILRTPAGWHHVQVVRVEEFSDALLLGMSRLADLDHPDDIADTKLAGWQYLCFSSLRQKLLADGSWSVGGAAYVAIAMIGIAVGGFYLAGYTPPTSFRGGLKSLSTWTKWEASRPAAVSSSTAASTPWNFGGNGGNSPTASPVASTAAGPAPGNSAAPTAGPASAVRAGAVPTQRTRGR